MTKRQILMKIWVVVEKVLGLMFVEKTEKKFNLSLYAEIYIIEKYMILLGIHDHNNHISL